MKRFLTISILITLFSATRAAADPITPRQILGGQYVSGSDVGQFSLFGPGFSLQGRTSVAAGCEPCPAGESQLISLGEVRDLSGTVDGVTYSRLFVAGSNGLPSNLSVAGQIFIPPTAIGDTQISFPFATLPNDQFFNRFVGYLSPPTGADTPAFNFFFSGNGTAVTTMHLDGRQPDGSPFFSPGTVVWTFNGTPSPTPEPASVALLGTGLAAVVLRRLRSGTRKACS
jgi:hypothetical protein